MSSMGSSAGSCSSCGTKLTTPLACEACGVLLDAPDGLTPFAALGLEPSFDLDAKVLRKTLLRLSRATHPDFYSNAEDDVRARAERNSAELNAAHELLADAYRRADWLVASLDGPSQTEERQMPQAFLMEVMEWNEAIEEARSGGSVESLSTLESELRGARNASMKSVQEALTPLPPRGSDDLVEARRSLNAVRYLDRALHEIAELRLAHAQSQ